MSHYYSHTKEFKEGVTLAKELGYNENRHALRDAIISIMKDHIKEYPGYTQLPAQLKFLSGVMYLCRSRIRKHMGDDWHGSISEFRILPFTLALTTARLIWNGEVDVINPKY